MIRRYSLNSIIVRSIRKQPEMEDTCMEQGEILKPSVMIVMSLLTTRFVLYEAQTLCRATKLFVSYMWDRHVLVRSILTWKTDFPSSRIFFLSVDRVIPSGIVLRDPRPYGCAVSVH